MLKTLKVIKVASNSADVPCIVACVQSANRTYIGFYKLGELITETHAMGSSYSNNEEVTEETFTDGWVRTGTGVTVNENMEISTIDYPGEMLKVCGF